jgi:hypothetical protein
MVVCMKTTVNLPDELLREAKELARREHVTLTALIERGLRAVVAEGEQAAAFVLPDATVDGNGMQREFRDAPWERIRDAIHLPS